MKNLLHSVCIYIALLSAFTASAQEASVDHQLEFSIFNASNGLADNTVQIIKCTKTGRMIIATQGNINFYDGANFNHIDTYLDYQLKLDGYSGNYNLGFDRYHHIWLKNDHSVTCVNLYSEEFIADPSEVVKELGCEEKILDVFVDSIGDVWFETPYGLYDVQTKKMHSLEAGKQLLDVNTYQDWLIVFYEDGDEMAINRESGEVVHTTSPSVYGIEEYSSSALTLRSDDIFYTIRNGEKGAVLLSFDVNSLEWKKLLEVPYHLNDLTLHDSLLYIPSDYSYWTFDPKTAQKLHYKRLPLMRNRSLSGKCNTISFDKQGGMWIGTESRGVLYARPHISPIKVYDLNSPEAARYVAMMDTLHSNISELEGKPASYKFTDSRNWTWYGTTTGLYGYMASDSTPIVYNKKNGLLNNIVHAIVEDHHNNLWVSTSYGLSCIIFEAGKPVFVNSFNNYDNVPNEAFIDAKALCLEDGKIVMQMIDHVIEFDPEKFETVLNKHRNYMINPKLIRLLVNGNFIEAGEEVDGNVILDRAITRVKDIWLNANQNSISLTFSGLNYFRPIQTCYRVRVKGIDEKWKVYSYFDGSRFVDRLGLLHLPMVNLKPGTYEIEVQASMFPNSWEDSSAQYIWKVHVNQPWWQATGVYALLVLVILVLVVVNIVIFTRNTRTRAHLNAENGLMLKRLEAFAERCHAYDNELLSPQTDELLSGIHEPELSADFIEIMAKLLPYIISNKNKLTFHEMCKICDTDIVNLNKIMSSNLYKSPRSLMMFMRLDKAARLLKTTNKTIEEISEECQFYTPNFFIGNFYHRYKMTPIQYRNQNK